MIRELLQSMDDCLIHFSLVLDVVAVVVVVVVAVALQILMVSDVVIWKTLIGLMLLIVVFINKVTTVVVVVIVDKDFHIKREIDASHRI